MKSFPNQYSIVINRQAVKNSSGKNRPYLIVYNDNLTMAMKKLSGTAFKVYIYLLSNKDNYKLEYSPQAIANEIGISKDSARKALKEFEAKRYIIPDREHPSSLQFYEYNSYVEESSNPNDFQEIKYNYVPVRPKEPKEPVEEKVELLNPMDFLGDEDEEEKKPTIRRLSPYEKREEEKQKYHDFLMTHPEYLARDDFSLEDWLELEAKEKEKGGEKWEDWTDDEF